VLPAPSNAAPQVEELAEQVEQCRLDGRAHVDGHAQVERLAARASRVAPAEPFTHGPQHGVVVADEARADHQVARLLSVW